MLTALLDILVPARRRRRAVTLAIEAAELEQRREHEAARQRIVEHYRRTQPAEDRGPGETSSW